MKENDLKQTQSVFKLLCEKLDEMELSYDKDVEKLSIDVSVRGDGLLIDISMTVDVDRQLIVLTSQMPYGIPEKRRRDVAVAVSQANTGIACGYFEFDYFSGVINFRMSSSIIDSLIGSEAIEYMLVNSYNTVKQYNYKFFIASMSEMTIEEILKYI